MKHKLEEDYNKLMNKNSSNWKWIFYVNREDPRIFVPKMNPMFGWTLNFGNKKAWIGLVIIILIAVLLGQLL